MFCRSVCFDVSDSVLWLLACMLFVYRDRFTVSGLLNLIPIVVGISGLLLMMGEC